MRILISAFACAPNRGSEPGVGWEWPKALAEVCDHEIVVLTSAVNRTSIETELAFRPSRIAFRYVALRNPFRRFGSPGHYLYYYLWQVAALLSLVRTGEWRGVDLIHHLTYGGIRTGSLLCLLPRPFMFGPVGGGESAPPRLSARLGKNKGKLERLRLWANRLSRVDPVTLLMQARATRILAKTPQTARYLNLFPGKVRTIIEIGAPSVAAATTVRQAGGPLRLLFAGKLLYWKGCDFVVDALSLLDQVGAGIELTIVGAGERQQAISAKIGRLKHIPATMKGLVPQPRLFEIYRNSDLFVFPSLHDSSGNVVLEAMAFGVPVLCFDLGGPPLIAGDAGIAVDVSDASYDEACRRLAGAIAKLRDDRNHLATLAAASALRAAGLTWHAAVRSGYAPWLDRDAE